MESIHRVDLECTRVMIETQGHKSDKRNHTEATWLKTLYDMTYELEAYRKLGTVEELKAMIEDYNRLKEDYKKLEMDYKKLKGEI